MIDHISHQPSAVSTQHTAHSPQQGQGARDKGQGTRRSLLEPCSLNLAPSRGFTLVELLVVIAILTILVSLVTAGAQAARRRAAVVKAKSMIAALETAIAMYQGDMGVYPPSENANLVAALSQDPGDPNWYGSYMDFKQDELVGGEVVDSWGQPYVYTSVNGGSPQHRPTSYDLYSFGPNAQDDSGTQDDIFNW